VIVLDTDVVSELLRPEPDTAVLDWLAAQRRGELYTTTISEGEIASGLALLPKSLSGIIVMFGRVFGS